MIIKSVEIAKLTIPRVEPLRIAIGSIAVAGNVAIKIATVDGLTGWGEAAPFAPITGDSQSTCFETAKEFARLVIGKDALAIEARTRDMKNCIAGAPSIRSAFDMALHDIAAKAADMPLYKFLGGEKRELRSDWTIGIQNSVEATVARASAVLAADFDAIKLKIGRPGLVDVDHVKAVRELAGPDVAIKVDSNQGWDLPTAITNLKAMAALEIEYSEQPLPLWDFVGLAKLRNAVEVPICADESVFDDHDALRLINVGAADYLNIKLGKAGGIRTALAINALAEAAGKKCMIGCFCESRLGLIAAAHLAMARSNIVFLDLDSAFDHTLDPTIGGMAFDKNAGGFIHLTDEPGLGVEFDESFFDIGTKSVVTGAC